MSNKKIITERKSLNNLTFEGIKIDEANSNTSKCFKCLIDYAIVTNQTNRLPEKLKKIVPNIKNFHNLSNGETEYLEKFYFHVMDAVSGNNPIEQLICTTKFPIKNPLLFNYLIQELENNGYKNEALQLKEVRTKYFNINITEVEPIKCISSAIWEIQEIN